MNSHDERGLETPVMCPNCGAPNAPDAARCSSCGMWLGSQGEIIDVTSGAPEPVEGTGTTHEGWQGGFQTATISGGRVTVFRGGNRGCLILAAIVALVGCCLCWVIWSGVGSIF